MITPRHSNKQTSIYRGIYFKHSNISSTFVNLLLACVLTQNQRLCGNEDDIWKQPLLYNCETLFSTNESTKENQLKEKNFGKRQKRRHNNKEPFEDWPTDKNGF